jgi:integrase
LEHLESRTMPRTNRPPAYRLHKARNCAVVTVGGKNHYLGRYGSPESHEAYARLVAGWRARPNPTHQDCAAVTTSQELSINGLILTYFRHVQAYYVKDGRPTSEQNNIRQALRFMRQLFGTSPANNFGPMALKRVREAMIDVRRSRKLINKDVNRIRQMFSWAAENEMLPASVSQALREVKGLRKGRSAARETSPIEPVAEEMIEVILPQLSPQLAAMVQLQYLCGARPQEVCSIRPCEVRTDGDAWLYQPQSHKTAHLDRNKVIVLGPKAQAVLRPWLDRDPQAHCFVPAEVIAWHRRRNRRRRAANSMIEGAEQETREQLAGKPYSRHSYRVAIQRACRRAGIPVWSPRQLRHTRATAVRQAFGLEAAKAILGHTDTKITEIYAERDLNLARRIMREIG